MKKVCSTLMLLFIFTGLWAQSNFVFKEVTPGYFNGNVPSTYISSCHIPYERVFTLKVLVNSADDEVLLKDVRFNTTMCFHGSGSTVIAPTSASSGTYSAGNSQIGKHRVFTIKTKDTYIDYFNCDLVADWDYKDKVTNTDSDGNVTVVTTTTEIRDEYLKGYWYISTMTDPTLEDYPEKKQCGKVNTFSIVMKYENNMDSYSITATNATVLTNTIVKSSSTCNPTLSFDLETERCGDVMFTINRTNTADSRTESYLIKSEFDDVGINVIESLNDNGQTHFCVIDGPQTVVLKGAFNEHFFETKRPNGVLITDFANSCSEIEGTWSILSSSTPGGISMNNYGVGSNVTFAYCSFSITQPGTYLIEYTLSACGKEVRKRIALTACATPPILASTPPIDLQYICSLEKPICASIVGSGCYNKITTSSTDYKLLTTSSNGGLCIGSVLSRTRTSQLNVTISNACGSDQATWNILVDYPEHCQNNNERLTLEQGYQTLAVRLEPSIKKQEGLQNGDERIQKVIIYDMNRQLIWSQKSGSVDNRVLLPLDKLVHARTYVVQVITNQNTYSKHFIK
jgi:hypothetical protein